MANPFLKDDSSETDSNPFLAKGSSVLKNKPDEPTKVGGMDVPQEYKDDWKMKPLLAMAKGGEFMKDAAETGRILAGNALSGMAAVGPAAMEFIKSGSLEKASNVHAGLMSGAGPETNNPMAQKAMEGLDYALVEAPGRAVVNATAAIPFVGQDIANKYENELRMSGEVAGQFIPAERIFRGASRPHVRPEVRPPSAEQQVIARAREIAQEQGRTTVTPADIRSAEGHKYEGGIDYGGPETTQEALPTKPEPVKGGMEYGKLELEDNRLEPARQSNRDKPMGFSEDNPFMDPNASVRRETDPSPPPQQYERGIGFQQEMDFQSKNYPNQEYTVGGVPAKGVVPTERQGYSPETKEMVNEGTLQKDLPPQRPDDINAEAPSKLNDQTLEDLKQRLATAEKTTRIINEKGDTLTGPLYDKGFPIRERLNYIEKQYEDLKTGIAEGWIDANTAQKIQSQLDRAYDNIDQIVKRDGPQQAELISQNVARAFEQSELQPPNPKYSAELAGFANKGDFRGALEHVQKTSDNTFYKWLSEALLIDPNFKPKLGVYDTVVAQGRKDAGQPRIGRYDMKTGEIQLNRTGGWHGSEWAVLHEGVHARLVELQWRLDNGLSLPHGVKNYINNIDSLYKWVASQLDPETAKVYGFKNAYEFLAEGFTNPDFQKILADISIPNDIFFERRKSGMISAWQGFIDQIFGIFHGMGFKQFSMDTGAKGSTALQVLLNEGAGALRAVGFDPSIAKVAYGPQGMKWADNINLEFNLPPKTRKAEKPEMQSFTDFKEEMKNKEGSTFGEKYSNVLYEEYRKTYHAENSAKTKPIGYDNRGHKDFRDDLYRTSDGKPRLDDVGYIFPIGPAYTMAEAHPVIRRVYDQVSQATVEKANWHNKWWHGAEIIDKGGFNPMKMRFTALSTVKRVEHPDSLAALSSNMTAKEGGKLMELISLYGESDPKALMDPTLLKANGASERTIKFLRTLSETNEQMRGEVNKVRADKGLEPIAKNESFWVTRLRYGAYQVFSHDAESRHTYLGGFNTMADAEKVAQHLRETKRLNVTAAPAEHNPRHFEIIPSDAFMQASNMLPDAAQRRALREAAEEAIKRVGINRYALPRDSKVGGYAGSTELINSLGEGKAWDSVKQSVENYVRQASNYVGTHEYGKKVGELFMDKDIKNDYPNAVDRSRYMWDQFVGVPRPLDEALRGVSKALGTLPILKNFVDDRTGHRLVSGAGNMFVTMKLVWLNPAFYLANGIQHVTIPSRLHELQAEHGKGNIYESVLRGESHMQLPTEYTKEIMHEAMRNGSIEARFAEALDWVQSKETAIPMMVKYAMGEKVAAYADSYSRASAYLTTFEYGKSMGLKDKEAHSFAARESQGMMVQYDRWARMPVLNKLGPIGDAVAPLTTYYTNQLFNVARYMKDVAKGPQNKHLVAPLLTSLASQLAIGGIKGMPFYEDMEKMYMMVAKQYIEQWGGSQDDIMLPNEFLSHVPSVLQDGVFSYATGVQMGGAMGMGTVGSGIGQMAGVQYAQDILSGFYYSLENLITHRGTRQDRFDNAAKLLPILAKEPLRAAINEKSPLEPANIQQKEGLTYRRNQKEQIAALLTGRTPLGEAETKRAKTQMNQIEESVKAAKEQARDRIVDASLSGAKLGRFAENVMTNYPEIFHGMSESLDRRILAMHIPFEEREVLRNKANYRLLELQRRAFANKQQNYSK